MQFFSTRDQNRKVTSSEAIAQGLSNEGGLFVPESFPVQTDRPRWTGPVRLLPRKSLCGFGLWY